MRIEPMVFDNSSSYDPLAEIRCRWINQSSQARGASADVVSSPVQTRCSDFCLPRPRFHSSLATLKTDRAMRVQFRQGTVAARRRGIPMPSNASAKRRQLNTALIDLQPNGSVPRAATASTRPPSVSHPRSIRIGLPASEDRTQKVPPTAAGFERGEVLSLFPCHSIKGSRPARPSASSSLDKAQVFECIAGQ